MSKTFERRVLIQGKPVLGIFTKDKTEVLIRLGNARFNVEQQQNGSWVASSLNDSKAPTYKAKTAELAYRKFVRDYLCTRPKTGRPIWA